MGEPKHATRGEAYESIAFQFCKIATFSLLFQKLTLPIASGLCAVLYAVAFAYGQRTSRCYLKYPLLISAFFAVVCAGSVWWGFRR